MHLTHPHPQPYPVVHTVQEYLGTCTVISNFINFNYRNISVNQFIHLSFAQVAALVGSLHSGYTINAPTETSFQQQYFAVGVLPTLTTPLPHPFCVQQCLGDCTLCKFTTLFPSVQQQCFEKCILHTAPIPTPSVFSSALEIVFCVNFTTLPSLCRGSALKHVIWVHPPTHTHHHHHPPLWVQLCLVVCNLCKPYHPLSLCAVAVLWSMYSEYVHPPPPPTTTTTTTTTYPFVSQQ